MRPIAVRTSFVLVLLLYPPAAWCGQARHEQQPPALTYKFIHPGGRTHIGFELNANKIYLPIRVNNRGPYWFILDTGSVSNVVDTDVANRLSITARDSFEARGAGEKTIIGALGSNVSLTISELELSQSKIDIEPVNTAISGAEGRTVDGLLGYDLLSRFVVEIDYVTRQVTIVEPGRFHYFGQGETIPLEIVRGNILVPADLTLPNGSTASGTFLIDTAWRTSLTLTSPFVATHNLLTTTPRTIDAVTGIGIGGSTVDTIGRVPRLKLGRYAIENFVAEFSHAKAGVLSQGDFAGVIGAEVLRRFNVIFDYPHGRMIIDPNAMFRAPYEFDMSGLFLTSEGGSSKGFKVYSTITGSPAADAGIREGDLIDAIDGQPASKFTLDQVRQMFKDAESKQHSLSIRRNGKTHTAKLRLRRII